MLELVEYAVVRTVLRNQSYFFAHVIDKGGNETNEVVFSHYNDHRVPERHDGDVIWNRFSLAREDGFHRPREGDRIVFERGTNAKGTKAVRWCYARQAHLAHHSVDAVTYVIRTEDNIVLWRGGYSPHFPGEPIVTYFGHFPHRIPAEFQLYRETPDDVGKSDYSDHYLDTADMWDAFHISLESAEYPPA